MQNEYYYQQGQNQQGPFSLEELLQHITNGRTMVWKTGEPSWAEASSFPEIAEGLRRKSNVPTPFQQYAPVPPPLPYQPQKRGKGPWRWIIGALLLVVALLGLLMVVSNANRGGYTGGPESYEQQKMSIADIERGDPVRFLRADGTYNKTLLGLGNKFRVRGTVANSASVANYKDIQIRVNYFSKTGAIIDSDVFVLYDFVPARTTKSFDWRIKSPSNSVERLGWDVVGAVGY